ncbi:efflux RND transporter periplasmic adaptor subunit [Oceanibacterium hippocampi]|uniref:Multidrug resistance protein MdtA n=1 Tax=Oceanibacterium hippocampi TaxID=745714 RepID=A0A1Y5TSJ3_9PROT|nr:efflux RND transporter periplasmic adaptor subunit [Oceanibacterium hippocampi]SLN70412.1 Multidrug resistance protein MdtA precursor [Oceanibacterium hippocampi]
MSIRNQILLVLLVSAFLYGGFVGWNRYFAPDATATNKSGVRPVPVETATARMETMSTAVEAVGSTLARQSIAIVPLAGGRVDRIAFQAGETIKAGGVIAELDDDIERANQAQSEAGLRKASLELERAKLLREKSISTRATVEDLTATKAAAEADVARARRKLADRTIRAPFAGTLGISRVDSGARVTDSTVITTLDDLSSVDIEFAVSETLFNATRIGQPVEATAAAFPGRKFVGKVTEIDSRIDAISRSFKVRARVPNPDRELPAGMFMHLRMILASSEALVIPEEAVVAESGTNFVFLLEDGKARRRKVTVGRRDFGIAEIVEGLQPGAVVVTRGTGKLREGSAVRVAANKTDALQ